MPLLLAPANEGALGRHFDFGPRLFGVARRVDRPVHRILPAMGLVPGTKLEGSRCMWEVVSPLVRGGMGEVYLARDSAAHDAETLVVVKTVRHDKGREPELVSRFRDEVRVAALLRHPHVARVLDVGETTALSFFVMEYCERGSVAELMEGGAVEEAAALQITCDILRGLDYAHHVGDPVTQRPLGIIHRDVAPQNVLLQRDGLVKLIDFGLARFALKQTRTDEGRIILGRLGYAAPESARGDEVDARSDQFSAAVICYELLTGERYYGQEHGPQLWQTVARGNHVPPALASLKPILRAVLGCALSGAPAERFENCGAFCRELERVLEEHHGGQGRASLLTAFERVRQDTNEVTNSLFADVDLPPSKPDDASPRTPCVHGTAHATRLDVQTSPAEELRPGDISRRVLEQAPTFIDWNGADVPYMRREEPPADLPADATVPAMAPAAAAPSPSSAWDHENPAPKAHGLVVVGILAVLGLVSLVWIVWRS
ncbi:MAG: serine/threonine protein kinase [Myxococcota bacterium]